MLSIMSYFIFVSTRKFYITTIASLILVIGCNSSDQNYTLEQNQGIPVVHNLRPFNTNSTISIEFQIKIGELDPKNDNEFLFEVSDIFFVNDIYLIVDSGNQRIQKFDADGKYLATIGQKGQGPGEFEYPVSIDVDGNQNIYVLEEEKISSFSFSGRFINSFKLDYHGWSSQFRIWDNETILISSRKVDRNSASGISVEPLIKKLNYEGEIVSEFVKSKEFNELLANQAGNLFDFEIDTNGNVFVSFKTQNRIEKYSQMGQLILEFDRILNFDDDQIQVIYDGLIIKEVINDNNISKGIGVDSKNRVWVATYLTQPKEGEEDSNEKSSLNLLSLEVYSNEGIMLDRLPIDFDFYKMRIVEEYIYFIDKERISVSGYKIIDD